MPRGDGPPPSPPVSRTSISYGRLVGAEPLLQGLAEDFRDHGADLLEELTERGHRAPTAYNRPGRSGQEAQGE